jgi:Thermostable hemolysin
MLEISLNTDSRVNGTLVMDERRLRKLTSVTPLGISITQWFQPDRDRIERFIESTYRYHYGSTIKGHYPTLMSVYDPRGRVLAAVGLRLAGDEPLFLEQYLEQPVDAAIRAVLGQPVGRDAIVEIGNLTSAGRGASVFLFVGLAAYLRQQRLAFAVATGTKGLRRSLARFGIEFRELGAADPSALPDGGASWGGYYERDPKIIAGAIQPAFARLEAYLPAAYNLDLERLFTRSRHPISRSLQ